MKKFTLEEVLDAAKKKLDEFLVPETDEKRLDELRTSESDSTDYYRISDHKKYDEFYWTDGKALYDNVLYVRGFCGLKGYLIHGINELALYLDNVRRGNTTYCDNLKYHIIVTLRGANEDKFIKAAEGCGYCAERNGPVIYIARTKDGLDAKAPRWMFDFHVDFLHQNRSMVYIYNLNKESMECKLISKYLEIRYAGFKGKLRKFGEINSGYSFL